MNALNAYQKAAIKNAAKAIAHYEARLATIDKNIEKLQAEKDELNQIIAKYNSTEEATTGHKVMELVEKVGSTWTLKSFEEPETKEEAPQNDQAGPEVETAMEPTDSQREQLPNEPEVEAEPEPEMEPEAEVAPEEVEPEVEAEPEAEPEPSFNDDDFPL